MVSPVFFGKLHKKMENTMWGIQYKLDGWAESHFLLYPDAMRYCSSGIEKRVELDLDAEVSLASNMNVNGVCMYRFKLVTDTRRVEFCCSSQEKRDRWVESINGRHAIPMMAQVQVQLPSEAIIRGENERRTTLSRPGDYRKSVAQTNPLSAEQKEGWLFCSFWSSSQKNNWKVQVGEWTKCWAVLRGATLTTYASNDLLELQDSHKVAHFTFKAEFGQREHISESLFVLRMVPPKRTYAFSPQTSTASGYLWASTSNLSRDDWVKALTVAADTEEDDDRQVSCDIFIAHDTFGKARCSRCFVSEAQHFRTKLPACTAQYAGAVHLQQQQYKSKDRGGVVEMSWLRHRVKLEGTRLILWEAARDTPPDDLDGSAAVAIEPPATGRSVIDVDLYCHLKVQNVQRDGVTSPINRFTSPTSTKDRPR
jgi:hypothetical protein